MCSVFYLEKKSLFWVRFYFCSVFSVLYSVICWRCKLHIQKLLFWGLYGKEWTVEVNKIWRGWRNVLSPKQGTRGEEGSLNLNWKYSCSGDKSHQRKSLFRVFYSSPFSLSLYLPFPPSLSSSSSFWWMYGLSNTGYDGKFVFVSKIPQFSPSYFIYVYSWSLWFCICQSPISVDVMW